MDGKVQSDGKLISAAGISTHDITGLVRGYFSQSSKLYGVLEASEHSLCAFLSRFDAI